MNHSNSSLNTYLSCQRKFWHSYINKTERKPQFYPHLDFGTLAHEVLEKAGNLRDNIAACIPDYDICIPSELYRQDLKNYFGIKTWHSYFVRVCKQVVEYERELTSSLTQYGEVQIEREIKLVANPADTGLSHPIVGVVDLLLYTKNHAIIVDYKFSTKKKTQDDFDMNSQLYLYAYLVNKNYNVPLHNIRVGYIDIPKQDFSQPALCNNGRLSRAKSQNISKELYIEAIKIVHPDTWEQEIAPGGYYHDVLDEYALNKSAYLSCQYLDEDAYSYIIKDVMQTAQQIEILEQNNLPFLSKYDAYSCSSCEYVDKCKPWLGVNHD